MSSNDLYLFFDAFKHDNKSVFANAFTSAATSKDHKVRKSTSTFFLVYDYNSYVKRRTRVRTSNKLNLVEFITVISPTDLLLPSKNRLLDPEQSNQTDVIGPVLTPELSSEWQLPIADKRKFLVGDARKEPNTCMTLFETVFFVLLIFV